jgi:hypothetical protein
MVWDAVGGLSYKDFSHWPNPTKNFMAQAKVLACEDSLQLHFKMIGLAAAAWFWTTFVPQPTEIVRKTLTGSYKCGFYLNVEFGSPLDIVWQDVNVELKTSEIVAEIVRPAVQGLFYLWAADTVFSIFQTWQSLIYAAEMCDLTRNECLLAEGSGQDYTGNSLGEANFYVELHDPNDWHTTFGGSISVPKKSFVQVDVFGWVLNATTETPQVSVHLGGLGVLNSANSFIDLGVMAKGQLKNYHLSFSGQLDPTEIGVELLTSGPSWSFPDYVELKVSRFTVTESEVPIVRHCTPWRPGKL